MKVVLVLSLILALSQATPKNPVCDICISAITQIEEVITDPNNEQLVSVDLDSIQDLLEQLFLGHRCFA